MQTFEQGEFLNLNYAFNNSAFSAFNRDYDLISIHSYEVISKGLVYPLLNVWYKCEKGKRLTFYIPFNARPSYEGKNASIRWIFEAYKNKTKVFEKTIKIISYPLKINFEIDLNKNKIIKLIRNKQNHISLGLEKNKIIKSIKFLIKENINNDSNIIFEKEMDFVIEQNRVHINFDVSSLPLTYRAFKSNLEAWLFLITNDESINLQLEIYDFDIFEAIKLGDVLEAAIFKHLAIFGPQTLGSLVSRIASLDKMRVKSMDVKESCKEMFERGLLEKDDRDWNSATYYLNAKIYERFIKG
jgi:hypothetical protein